MCDAQIYKCFFNRATPLFSIIAALRLGKAVGQEYVRVHLIILDRISSKRNSDIEGHNTIKGRGEENWVLAFVRLRKREDIRKIDPIGKQLTFPRCDRVGLHNEAWKNEPEGSGPIYVQVLEDFRRCAGPLDMSALALCR